MWLLPRAATTRARPANVRSCGEEFAKDASEFFRDQLDIATPMWDSPVQSFALDQLNRALERVANKVDKPRDALAEAHEPVSPSWRRC